jgi:hypothetical protein
VNAVGFVVGAEVMTLLVQVDKAEPLNRFQGKADLSQQMDSA